MPLADLNPQQRGLLDYLFVPEQEEEVVPTPQSFFNLPPPPPVRSYFSGSRGGNRDPYGFIEKSRELQMMMQAEKDAERAGQLLSGINPADPSYPQQRLQIIAQAPLADRDPRGKAMLGAADFTYQQSRQRNPQQAVIERAAMEGVTPQEVAQFTMPDGTVDTVALSNLAGQRRLANRPQRESPRDRSIEDLNTAYRALELLGGEDARKERERIGREIVNKTRQLYGGGEPTAAPSTPKRDFRSEYNY